MMNKSILKSWTIQWSIYVVDSIGIRGVRTYNLKGFNLILSRHALIVIQGYLVQPVVVSILYFIR